jgi:trk system potassium uptake protein TrkH
MQTVHYAVRISPILKYFGQLCIPMGVLTLVPLSVSLFFGAYSVSLRYGILVAGILALGTTLMRLPAPKQLQTNEAMVITAMIFLFAPLVMSWPIMASGLSFSDALFETISAVTTTGLSTLPMVSDKPETFLFSRAWMQWVGGLGIVVLCLAVVVQPGMVAKRLGDLQDYEADPVGGTRAPGPLPGVYLRSMSC